MNNLVKKWQGRFLELTLLPDTKVISLARASQMMGVSKEQLAEMLERGEVVVSEKYQLKALPETRRKG